MNAFGELLNCSICYEAFKAPLKEPLILTSCGHTVCSECVKKLIEAPPTRRSVNCPSCRTASDVPANGFRKNYSLADIIPKAMAIETSKFVGSWNLKGFPTALLKLRFLRMFGMTRKLLLPHLIIEVNGEHWKINFPGRSSSADFELDKEYEVTTADGRRAKRSFHFDGDKLIVVGTNFDGEDEISKGEMHLEEGKLVLTIETGMGVKSNIVFKRA